MSGIAGKDVEANAAGLTEAQRRFLCAEGRSIGNPAVWIIIGNDASSNRTLPTRTVLIRKGLMERGRFGPTMLTPLGLAVRAYLEGQSPNPSKDPPHAI